MNTTRYALIAFKATMLLFWSGAAIGAVLTLPVAAENHVLDLWLVFWSCITATLAGGAALASRVNKLLMREDEGGGKFVRPWSFAVAHMLGSWSAGFAMFLFGGAQHWDVQYVLFLVLVASFGGAAVMERLAERLFSTMPLNAPGTPPANS